MNPLKHSIKATFTLCVLFFLFGGISETFAQYKVGDTVADFTLADVNGDSISLFDYRGKVILLNFFTSFG